MSTQCPNPKESNPSSPMEKIRVVEDGANFLTPTGRTPEAVNQCPKPKRIRVLSDFSPSGANGIHGRVLGDSDWGLLYPHDLGDPPVRLVDVSSWNVGCKLTAIGLDVYKEFGGGWHVGKVVALAETSNVMAHDRMSQLAYTVVFDDKSCLDLNIDVILDLHSMFVSTDGLVPVRVVIGDAMSCDTDLVDQRDYDMIFPDSGAVVTLVHYRDAKIESFVSTSVIGNYGGVDRVGICIGKDLSHEYRTVSGDRVWVFQYAVGFDDGSIRYLSNTEMIEASARFANTRPCVQPIKAVF